MIRIISLSKYNAHSEPIFKKLNLLKVKDILKLQELKFYNKFKKIKLPHNLQMLPMKCINDIHYHATRVQHSIHLNRTKHEYAKKCLCYDLPKVINDTPTTILDKINTHCLKGFATYIKHCIFKSYQEICIIVNCCICNRN